MLASIGGFAAAAYWALLARGVGFAVYRGSVSFGSVIMPVILIVMYVHRGVLIMRGDAPY